MHKIKCCVVSCVVAVIVDKCVQHLSVGERVRIESDAETAIELQEGHGGWTKPMRKVRSWHLSSS